MISFGPFGQSVEIIKTSILGKNLKINDYSYPLQINNNFFIFKIN